MRPGLIVLIISLIVFAAVATMRPEFLHLPSLLLTLGGAASVLVFSYSPRQMQDFFEVSRNLLVEKPLPLQDYADELARLTQLYRGEGLRGLELAERRLKDPFLRKAVGMLVDLQKEETICATLERTRAEARSGHEIAKQILSTLSKLLPAFGLIGTLIGMVLLLSNAYVQDMQSLPDALSLAVLTTLYGAVFANVIVAPLAVRLQAAAAEKEMRMDLTLDWAIMVVRGNTPSPLDHHWNRWRSDLEASQWLKKPTWGSVSSSFQRPPL